MDSNSKVFVAGHKGLVGSAIFRNLESKHYQNIYWIGRDNCDLRKKVFDIISQGLKIHTKMNKEEIYEKVKTIINDVGLQEEHLKRYPHEFSGGQRQRIGIARSLAVKPEILIADEPVSALDVSIQAQILELLDQIRDQMNLAMIFITHDLRVAAQVCDRVAVMRQGEVVETGSTSELFSSPKHDYTQALLAAVPGKTWQEGILAN